MAAIAARSSALTWNARGDVREMPANWPDSVTPEWAWAGATGQGVRVCVVDSGVERDHPLVGPVAGSYHVVSGAEGGVTVAVTDSGDLCGHGTACAGIIRSIAPRCEIYSVRVLGENFAGTGEYLLTGLRWAIEQGFDVVNMSLSTRRPAFVTVLHELADQAFFKRTMIVASAHNLPVESFPWRFSSVLSVGSHDKDDAGLFLANPQPPVEFFAHGQNVSVAWLNGGRTTSTGNSFATPHIAGRCALILSKHPGLTAFQLKTALYLTAANVRGAH
jgi:subtilisin